jgi:3-phosphoshikimate 1-carboxyvinyltransferase
MDRIAEPLRRMGAAVDGREHGRLAPLVIRGGGLTGITNSPRQASAQVKSALLLAGLSATGPTTVEEVHPTRRHTEEMLTQCGGRVRVDGTRVTVEPGELTGKDIAVPGDPSQAAFWAVGALLALEQGEVVVENLYPGFGRSDFVGVLRRMGAAVDFDLTTGTLVVKASRLRAVDLTAEDIPGIVDEVPVRAMAAALAGHKLHLPGGHGQVHDGQRAGAGDEGIAVKAPPLGRVVPPQPALAGLPGDHPGRDLPAAATALNSGHLHANQCGGGRPVFVCGTPAGRFGPNQVHARTLPGTLGDQLNRAMGVRH